MKKTCLHCGYTWTPRIETEPKACPRCKSPRWDEPPRKSGRPRKITDSCLLKLYQDKNDVEAGREIAQRIKARTWTLGG